MIIAAFEIIGTSLGAIFAGQQEAISIKLPRNALCFGKRAASGPECG
jgi:hypothetical protein